MALAICEIHSGVLGTLGVGMRKRDRQRGRQKDSTSWLKGN